MTEEYIEGYLECISRVKDFYTPDLGGHNGFFGVPRNKENSLMKDLVDYVYDCNSRTPYRKVEKEEIKRAIKLTEINNWSIKLIPMIEKWTCDKILDKENKRNIIYLSERLVDLLQDFFNYDENIKLYEMKSEIQLQWSDCETQEYLFEAENKFYILHFGESS